MSDVYYIIGGVAYGIFILQFIISWVAGELDVEGTKRKLLAEAEGKRASLMAEADKITAVEMAPAKGSREDD